jgi:hypothetical protein
VESVFAGDQKESPLQEYFDNCIGLLGL